MNNQVLISQEIIFCDFFLSACYESMFSYAWTWVLQYYMVCELIKLCALGTDSRLVSRCRAEGSRDLKCKKITLLLLRAGRSSQPQGGML